MYKVQDDTSASILRIARGFCRDPACVLGVPDWHSARCPPDRLSDGAGSFYLRYIFRLVPTLWEEAFGEIDLVLSRTARTDLPRLWLRSF